MPRQDKKQYEWPLLNWTDCQVFRVCRLLQKTDAEQGNELGSTEEGTFQFVVSWVVVMYLRVIMSWCICTLLYCLVNFWFVEGLSSICVLLCCHDFLHVIGNLKGHVLELFFPPTKLFHWRENLNVPFSAECFCVLTKLFTGGKSRKINISNNV